MKHANSICRQVNCNRLIAEPGYCSDHKYIEAERFKGLHKADRSGFYSSSAWTKTSRAFRRMNPLCAEHKRRGTVVKGDLVHHTVEVGTLKARGDNPLSWRWLETLCVDCHNKELRKRQGQQGREPWGREPLAPGRVDLPAAQRSHEAVYIRGLR